MFKNILSENFERFFFVRFFFEKICVVSFEIRMQNLVRFCVITLRYHYNHHYHFPLQFLRYAFPMPLLIAIIFFLWNKHCAGWRHHIRSASNLITKLTEST